MLFPASGTLRQPAGEVVVLSCVMYDRSESLYLLLFAHFLGIKLEFITK